MLEQILVYIHNWFERQMRVAQWTIEGGSINLPHVQDGQYFRIVGSTFNDGLHQYPCDDLTDETFVGGVWALVIPHELVELSEEIKDWQEKYGEKAEGPYTSESFGGYSYSKDSGDSQTGDLTTGWQRAFRSRLIPYRKL